ncbi:MAG: AMP-binding protein [Clostridiales Family XIII bacterium]|nr:AMP-binding protein [Clostridiales Family XIII bacterium]
MNSIKYKDVLYEHRDISDLKELVNSSAAMFSERDAFLVKDSPGGAYRPISYRQMKSDIDSLGAALFEYGLLDGKIALIGENRYEWVISYLAVTNGGGVIVPFDRELGAEDLSAFMKRADVRTIIYSSKLESVATETDRLFPLDRLISMDAREHAGRRLSLPKLIAQGEQMPAVERRAYIDAPIDPDALCAVLFTSGTTGLPKGVMLSHRNIAANVFNMSKYVNVSGLNTGLSVLPMHHTYEMTCHIMTAIYQGCRVAICEGLKYIVKNMAEAKASVMLGVPLIFESMHKKVWRNAESKGKAKKMRRAIAFSKMVGGQNTKAVKRLFKEVHRALGGNILLLISGGAAIDPFVVEDFNAMGFPMIQGYGMTENAPIIAVNKDRYSKPASVGLPMPGTEVRIADEDESGIGEIICRGDSVMLGYYDDPEETARVLTDGWLHTGDFGYFDDEGFLYVTGRKKNIIVTKNGKNISPEELEYYLYKIPYISEVMVWGATDERSGDAVICADIFPNFEYIEDTRGRRLDPSEIKRILKPEIDRINERLPNYKRIKRFALRDSEFEKTTVKKIKRHAVVHGAHKSARGSAE